MVSLENAGALMRYKSGYAICVLIGWFCALSHAASPEALLPENHLGLFETYCFECHDSLIEEGEVNLETIAFNISEDMETAETWQKVLNALNSGEMPPDDEPQIPNSEKTVFLDDLSNQLAAARKILSDSGGKITMRRLNLREYQNTIEQLTGTKVDVSSLPTDGGSGTYDTVGASQFISSDQFEQYLKIGREAIDEAFDRQANAERQPTVYRLEPETFINPLNEELLKNWDATRERFLHWQIGVDKAAAVPTNQDKAAELWKKDPDPIRFYYSANLLEGSPDPTEFGFKDAQDAANSNRIYHMLYPYYQHYADLPYRDQGTYLKLAHPTGAGITRIDVNPPGDMPLGTYVMRIRAGVVEGSPASRHFVEIGYPLQSAARMKNLEGLPISCHQVTGTIQRPAILETRLEVTEKVSALKRRGFAIQERHPFDRTQFYKTFGVAAKLSNGYGSEPAVWIDWIELEGPIPDTGTSAELKQILDRHSKRAAKSEKKRARAILTDFAHTALRRVKPDTKFIDQILAIFETRRKAGESFEVAIRTPLSVILASPGFLYLNEPGDEDAPRLLNDRELAVRLAYFLWSAPPDAPLLELAERNKLRKPKILRQQVDRLIADPRSAEFVSGFVHQWLDMERLDFFQFDVKLHLEFDESARVAAREEVYQSFAHLLRDPDNGRLGKLLDSDYVVINGLLATYYGIDGVTGDEFRKVALPADSPRGGLLGMAAIHAMGSDGVNSSPVERGAWVLRHLLNDPPPPAPPNVPQISRLDDQVLTTRERLSAHMEEAQCASCHRKIDPIGFGLENFNAAGKWRATDHDGAGKLKKTWKIDASGAFHNGPAFSDYHELRELIANREDDFARGFVEHLIEYALGRPFGFIDEDLANEIVSSAENEQYALRAFIQALVRSEAFQKK